jgi:hypothetical protein
MEFDRVRSTLEDLDKIRSKFNSIEIGRNQMELDQIKIESY